MKLPYIILGHIYSFSKRENSIILVAIEILSYRQTNLLLYIILAAWNHHRKTKKRFKDFLLPYLFYLATIMNRFFHIKKAVNLLLVEIDLWKICAISISHIEYPILILSHFCYLNILSRYFVCRFSSHIKAHQSAIQSLFNKLNLVCIWYLCIGNTPLLLAAKNGHEDIVKELIQHGADMNDKNKEGKFFLFIFLYSLYKRLLEVNLSFLYVNTNKYTWLTLYKNSQLKTSNLKFL